MEPALEQLAGPVQQPTYEEAKTHLHNLAHMFMSPLVLLASLEVVEAKTAVYGELVDQVNDLQRRHDDLLKDCTDLEGMKRELEAAVAELDRRKGLLTDEVSRVAARFVAQAQQPGQD